MERVGLGCTAGSAGMVERVEGLGQYEEVAELESLKMVIAAMLRRRDKRDYVVASAERNRLGNECRNACFFNIALFPVRMMLI